MRGEPSRPARASIAATVLVALSMLRCAVPAVHGAPAPPSGRDGGGADHREADATLPAPAVAEGEKAEAYGSSWIGLTRGQLEARRGRPTEKRGERWSYTLPQPGCSEREMSEVFTFKSGRVAKVTLVQRQTSKICGSARQRPR